MADAEDNRFNERSLEGSWGYSAHGVAFVDDAEVPFVVVGLFSFDGEGECSHSFTFNFGGDSEENVPAEACTYEVNSDGTGTITFSFEGEEEVTIAFVLVDEAEEFHFIDLSEAALSGTAERQ